MQLKKQTTARRKPLQSAKRQSRSADAAAISPCAACTAKRMALAARSAKAAPEEKAGFLWRKYQQ